MADKSNYEYYKTKNGYVDLSAYDELEQVEFFIDHPDAMEVTDVELRSEGIVRPSSAEFLEREELEGLANDEEIEKFKFIKFGTYSHKEGYRSGGKGDKVSREDFQTDEEWARYQNWNGDVKEPKLTLDEQINEACCVAYSYSSIVYSCSTGKHMGIYSNLTIYRVLFIQASFIYLSTT